jgi:alpha-mannosidase
MKIYYFNSSHWDREWYQTFQQFRYYLVALGENILDCLENNPEFKVFNFDGQSVVLEDILEIKPEWRERFEKLIKAGKLNVGPWYVQPDEFLVSGEALIHNLLIGHELAEAFSGRTWKAGYLCDIFGHIAQMPQILSGFDIDNALIWRGAPNDVSTYFNWLAPNGTSCATVKMPRLQGYGDFSGNVVGFWDIPLSEEEFKAKARKYIDKRVHKTSSSLVLLFDGVDHAPIHKAIPQYIKWLKELYPDADVEFSNILDLLAEVKASGSLKDNVSGELATTTQKTGGFQHLISHTLSSYYPLKQANDECQNLLELLVSPLVAMDDDNAVNDRDFLKQAWKLLIQNQAHDSICGCSIDQVHKDMEHRFDQVKAIADALVSEFIVRDRKRYTGSDIRTECHHISGGVTHVEPNGKNGKLAVRFYNPLPYERNEVMNFEIVFPSEYSETYAEPFGYETINSFTLKDQSGNLIPYNITGIKRNYTKRFYRFDARQYNCYNVSAEVSLASAGWTTLAVEPSEKAVRNFGSQVTGHLQAENSFLKLQINRDGSFDVTEKNSGRKYCNLNNFVADGEIGDGWNHVAPKGNLAVLGSNGNATVKLVEDSSMRTVFEIVQDMILPEEMLYGGTLNENYAGISQSEKEAVLKIKTQVTLDAGSKLLKLKTEIDNNVKDYRLRLLLPTGIQGNYFAHQAFCFLDRAPGRAFGNATADWKEPEQLEKNFNGIVGKRDENGGIAFISQAGLHEVGSVDNENGDLYLTFLRAFRRTVATNGEIRCQLQQKMSWDYGLYFFNPAESNGDIYRQYQLLQMPLINYTAHFNDEYAELDNNSLKLESQNICMSIIKPVEKGCSDELLVRLVNFGDFLESVTLTTSKEISECRITNMEESCMQQVKVEKNRIILELKPKKIETIKIKLIEKV